MSRSDAFENRSVPEFRIGLMTPADISGMVWIEERSQPEPWSRKSFVEELGRPFSRVDVARSAVAPHEPLGYICCWAVADELQILNLTVHEVHRRRGIARALLHQALLSGRGRSLRMAVLELRRSNLAARALYESVGFQAVGQRPNYYGKSREPAILMELDLARYLDSCRSSGMHPESGSFLL